MKTQIQMPKVAITTASGEAEVVFTSNMRFVDFMRHNDYDVQNIDIANEHYKNAKVVFAGMVEKELQKLQAIDVKQSAVYKNGTFKVRSTITKEQDADGNNIQHESLVRQWANKKAVESQKAQEKASVFLAIKNQAAKAA